MRQRWGNDCGPAALATVAAHYGRRFERDVWDEVALDRQGADLLTLSRGAERLGFRTRGVTASYDGIGICPLPAIAHVRRRFGVGHFVVVHAWTTKHVVIADPAAGLRRVSRRVFCRRSTGYFLLVVPADAEVVDA
ncbi:MAG: ATP-binding cassette, subfamily bacteriocin exporter [Pseudonocardiales bacterium]|nr:ATP-binding cassette, subfamily bacteriocin exporter [Pseudonocardiales bacterium]